MIEYDVIGYPRLVRLNPNIPWKTRGNGAISLQVGKEGKKKIKIGEIDEEDIVISLELKQDIDKSDFIKIRKIIKEIIKEYARTEIDVVSLGYLTHSARVLDMSLEMTI